MHFVNINRSLVNFGILLGLLLLSKVVYSQTDTKFWFSVPEINRYHTGGTDANHQTLGGPTYLRLTAGKLGTRFWIEMPANSTNFNGGVPYTDSIPPNSTKTIDLLTLKFVGDDNLTPPFGEHPTTSMENRLSWTVSDIAPATVKKYINRNNKGVLVTSDAPITVYYEISSKANMELLALKGRNALGREFYIPFQTNYPTTTTQYTSVNHQYRPYSSFDIVATEDNTEIEITPPQPVFVYPGQNLPAAKFTIWLNKGQTAIIPPYANASRVYNTSYTNRLVGAYVKVVSGGDVAIITRDDMVMAPSGNVDFVGDQIVPIDLLGMDYAVVRGRLTSAQEYAYVIGTQASTNITVNGVGVGSVNAGGVLPIQIPSTNPITTIHGDKPIYVYHLSGFTAGAASTQFAGAIIPTITVCTGSSQVAFNRTKANVPSVGYYDFYLNILVRDGAETNFSITDKNGNDATGLIPGLNNAGSYALVGTTDPFNKWRYASFLANNIVSGADEAYLIKNSKDVFHLGTLNGYGGYDAFYGYFSDFNAFNPSSYVVGTGSSGTKECYGNDVQLYSSGGTTYSWTPTDFLDDPQSDIPVASDVKYSVDYKVTIGGACGFSADRIVKLFVSDYINPAFSPDKFSACATKVNPADTAKATFTFTDQSTGDYYRRWFYRNWDKSTNTWKPWVDFKSGNDADPDPANIVSFDFPNPTNDTIRYEIMLEVADDQEICFKTIVNSIVVYPYIDVNPSFSTLDPNHCQPLLVNFKANPIGNYGSAYYSWDFGDGGTSANPDPAHTYSNFATTTKTFTANVTLTDQWNYCSVTKPIDITVQPYIKASFVVDAIEGCYPFSTNIVNDSKAAATTQYNWDKDGDGVYETTAPGNWTYTHLNSPSIDPDTVVVRLKLDNGGCLDSIQRTIVVFPRATASTTSTIVGDAACAPLQVDFTSTTTNANIYHWLIDGNAVDNVTTTSYTFDNYGAIPVNKLITFTADNQWGCSASAAPITITVNPFVEAIMAIDIEEGCSPLTVNLTNASSLGSSVFEWDIDNNGTVDFSTKNIAAQTFTYPVAMNDSWVQDTIPIKLTAKNGAGCTSQIIRNVIVNPQAVSSFTYDDNGNTNLCSPVQVDFDGTYSNAEYFQWQFGDLGAATTADPFFILTNTSNAVKPVQVDLVASNRFGCNAPMVSQTINVQPEIKAEFSLSNAAGCAPLTYTIAAPPTSGTYTWDINGLTSTGDSQTITVSDNETGSTQIYSITLTASNGTCTDVSAPKIVAVYPEVEAKWDNPDLIPAACSPLNLTINNTSTLYNSAAVLSDVFWELTDGGSFNISSINQSVSQQLINSGYELPKNYTLTLTARSSDGCTEQKTSPITVNPPVDAAFNASIVDACTPMRIQFSDASQVKSGTTYNWGWDGGTTISNVGEDYLMEYTNADPELAVSRTVTLGMTNIYGCTDAASYTFSVNPVVVAALNVDITSTDSICAPDDIVFKNNSTGGTLTFNWNFGDGNQETVSHRNNITHNYSNRTATPQTRTVTLTATNTLGCTNVVPASMPVTILPEIEADYTMTIDSICTPVQVSIANNSLNGTSFTWNFVPNVGAPISVTKTSADPPFTQILNNTQLNANTIYTVGLSANSVYGTKTCSSTTAARTVTVLPELLLNFNPLPAAVCSGLPINFDNLSSGGALNYAWDFNDGQSAASSAFDDVQHTFVNRDATSITRDVTVTAVNSKGCTRTQHIPVIVHPKVEAGFVFAQQSQCTPFSLDLSNISLNGNKYNWTTTYNGDTITRNKNQFVYLFDNTTLNDILTDTIKLVSRDTVTGCADSLRQTVTIYPRVVSQFDINRIAGCNPLPVSFTNNSSGLATYLWEFGDGATSVDNTPATRNFSHTYKDQTQDFTIKLTATNRFGCKSFKDTIITVYPLVKADFQWNKFEGCTPLSIDINNSSTSLLYKYSWDFGDGTPRTYVEQPTSHTYTNGSNTPPVIQTPFITLRASYVNDTVCIDSMKLPLKVFPHIYPDFTTNFAGCHPHNVVITNQTVSFNNSSDTYTWDLGNGVNSLDVNPALTYINTSKTQDSTFSVLLRARSIHGCEDSIRHNITVHPRPFAAMELTGEYISCPPFPVEIENNSIGTNLTNIYTFGDGTDSTTTSMANMNHEFHNLSSNTEPYQIQLKTVTAFGCDDSISQTVYVYPEVVARFDAPVWAACNPFEITLQNNSTNAYFYRWDFDDGVTSSLGSPKHRFVNLTENDMVFDVSLHATSEFDCFDDTVRQIRVWSTPVANLAVDPALKTFPDATFNVLNQSNPAPANWDYLWYFGDNTTSTQKDPVSHTYMSWGPKADGYKYNVSLVVQNPNCKDSSSTFVYLLPAAPEAFFTSNIDSACSPLEVHFINASEYADSYLWDFGDGSPTSNEAEPIHTYETPGYYTAKLTVSGDGGIRTFYRIYRVYQNPIADFKVIPSHVMLPDATVRFFNTSKDFNRCFWDLGDGTQTDEKEPIHTYNRIANFKVTLWAYMDYRDINNNIVASCRDSVSDDPAVWVQGKGFVKFPNAFKPSTIGPNGGDYTNDDKNEIFHPDHYGVTEYKLMIFSRWGEQLFTSNNVSIGWDGYVNGRLAEQGVYMWRAIGTYTNGKTFDIKGNVTLLR